MSTFRQSSTHSRVDIHFIAISLHTFENELYFKTVRAAALVLELNPFLASQTTVGYLSLPGILSSMYCVALMVYFVLSGRYMSYLEVSMSQYMLSSIGNYVSILGLIITRLTAGRSSVSLYRTLKFLQTWDSVNTINGTKKFSKVSVLVIAMLFGSAVYALWACVKNVLGSSSVKIRGFVGDYPLLGLVVMLCTVLTNCTAVTFALTYVVVIGEELTHVYSCLCVWSKGTALWHNDHKTRELKLQFKLLKKFVHAFEKWTSWYSACIIASSAMAWLQVIAIVATDIEQNGLIQMYYGFTHVISCALLMLAGNRIKMKVSQSFAVFSPLRGLETELNFYLKHSELVGQLVGRRFVGSIHGS